MRLINKTVFAGVVLFFILGVCAYAADTAKIGIVDFRKILEESNVGKSGRAEIKKKGEEMGTDLKKKGAELDELKKQYDKNAMVTNKDVMDEKERELKIKYMDFQNLEKKYTSDIQKLHNDLLIRLKNDVDVIVDGIGKKEDYQLIIEKNQAGVFYSQASADITDKVIQQLNAKSAPKSGK